MYKIKKRVESKSLIVLLDDVEQLSLYVEKIPDVTKDLIMSVDTPLTIIYSNAKKLARNVIAMDKTVGIRIVQEVFCKTLIHSFGKPIVSTSANVSNEPTALTFHKISKEITEKVDYVVNLHQDTFNRTRPSTIIRLLENGEFVVVRR